MLFPDTFEIDIELEPLADGAERARPTQLRRDSIVLVEIGLGKTRQRTGISMRLERWGKSLRAREMSEDIQLRRIACVRCVDGRRVVDDERGEMGQRFGSAVENERRCIAVGNNRVRFSQLYSPSRIPTSAKIAPQTNKNNHQNKDSHERKSNVKVEMVVM